MGHNLKGKCYGSNPVVIREISSPFRVRAFDPQLMRLSEFRCCMATAFLWDGTQFRYSVPIIHVVDIRVIRLHVPGLVIGIMCHEMMLISAENKPYRENYRVYITLVTQSYNDHCLAKELARRKSLTMSPAACMRACLPA